jgi:predicted CXXCH cytochrome family protein
MKSFKVTMAVAASALLLAAPAMAFHDGGVAKCEGCHTMHNSLDGATMPNSTSSPLSNGTQFNVAGYLLQGNGSTSDACLVCHQGDTDTAASSYHVSTLKGSMDAVTKFPLQMGPGGDFGWINLATGSAYKRGHNIVAPAHGYSPDGRFTGNSPGGSYPAGAFNCASCHDPHGKFRYVSDGAGAYGPEVTTGAPIVESSSYPAGLVPVNEALGVYRILGGAGYSPKSIAGVHTFTDKAPVAVTTSNYNGSELSAGVITQRVVAYGSNMSEWCANCHQSLFEGGYNSGEAGHTHPAANGEKLDSFIVTAYNAYIASGNPVGGKGVAGYSTLVPFETGATMANRAALEADLAANGPTAAATSNVSCLSCHRAHASGFNSMLRYDPASFMTVADTNGATVYSTQTDANTMLTAAYYGRPASSFISYQRALCNKCHAKD